MKKLRRTWQSTPVFFPGEASRTEEPGSLQSMGSGVGPYWATKHSTTQETTHIYTQSLVLPAHITVTVQKTLALSFLLPLLTTQVGSLEHDPVSGASRVLEGSLGSSEKEAGARFLASRSSRAEGDPFHRSHYSGRFRRLRGTAKGEEGSRSSAQGTRSAPGDETSECSQLTMLKDKEHLVTHRFNNCLTGKINLDFKNIF